MGTSSGMCVRRVTLAVVASSLLLAWASTQGGAEELQQRGNGEVEELRLQLRNQTVIISVRPSRNEDGKVSNGLNRGIGWDPDPNSDCNSVDPCRKRRFPKSSCGDADDDCNLSILKGMNQCLELHSCDYLRRQFCENEIIFEIDFWRVSCFKWGLEEATSERKDRLAEERILRSRA